LFFGVGFFCGFAGAFWPRPTKKIRETTAAISKPSRRGIRPGQDFIFGPFGPPSAAPRLPRRTRRHGGGDRRPPARPVSSTPSRGGVGPGLGVNPGRFALVLSAQIKKKGGRGSATRGFRVFGGFYRRCRASCSRGKNHAGACCRQHMASLRRKPATAWKNQVHALLNLQAKSAPRPHGFFKAPPRFTYC